MVQCKSWDYLQKIISRVSLRVKKHSLKTKASDRCWDSSLAQHRTQAGGSAREGPSSAAESKAAGPPRRAAQRARDPAPCHWPAGLGGRGGLPGAIQLGRSGPDCVLPAERLRGASSGGGGGPRRPEPRAWAPRTRRKRLLNCALAGGRPRARVAAGVFGFSVA